MKELSRASYPIKEKKEGYEEVIVTTISSELSGTYNVSSSVTGAFSPLYHAATNLGYQSVSGTGLVATSGTSTLTTAGGIVGTANSVYDSTGVTVRSTSTVPYETDIVKLNGLYTFTAPASSNVVSASGSTTPTTFTVTTNANNKNICNIVFIVSIN